MLFDPVCNFNTGIYFFLLLVIYIPLISCLCYGKSNEIVCGINSFNFIFLKPAYFLSLLRYSMTKISDYFLLFEKCLFSETINSGILVLSLKANQINGKNRRSLKSQKFLNLTCQNRIFSTSKPSSEENDRRKNFFRRKRWKSIKLC